MISGDNLYKIDICSQWGKRFVKAKLLPMTVNVYFFHKLYKNHCVRNSNIEEMAHWVRLQLGSEAHTKRLRLSDRKLAEFGAGTGHEPP